eukprot:TRINITY_DN76_c0_g1_i8.p2 TRINITY_DN76_c0_g1~~TRINITY_DN76_c0_g1_i8.p2  ORF type:complete len:124 (+),score=19.62 TRINITY_DN76_c0_g1_i8:492-863(+)
MFVPLDRIVYPFLLHLASLQTFYDAVNNMKPTNYTSYKPAIAQNLVAAQVSVDLLCFSAHLSTIFLRLDSVCSEELDKHGRRSSVYFSIIKLWRERPTPGLPSKIVLRPQEDFENYSFIRALL